MSHVAKQIVSPVAGFPDQLIFLGGGGLFSVLLASDVSERHHRIGVQKLCHFFYKSCSTTFGIVCDITGWIGWQEATQQRLNFSVIKFKSENKCITLVGISSGYLLL